MFIGLSEHKIKLRENGMKLAQELQLYIFKKGGEKNEV